MRQRSIGGRLTMWYALALATGLVLFALATWFSLRYALLSDVNAALAARVASLEKFVNVEAAERGVQLREELEEYGQALPAGTGFDLKDDRGLAVFAMRRDGAASYCRLVRTVWVNGRPWRVEFWESVDWVRQILGRLQFLLIALIPMVAATAALGGWWLSRRALKPVDEMTAAARSIGIGNLSGRLPVKKSGDELERLSEAWNDMLSRLESAVKRLSRFTADASHELRTPLAVIRTTAEIAMRRSRSEEAYREALSHIVDEAERMTRLVEDLLFLARCDAEAAEMPQSALNLRRVLENVCAEMRPLADSKQVRLEPELTSGHVFVTGNESAVRRLVLVLVDNAIKYSRAGGKVDLRLEESANEVHLEIRDSGAGIPETEMPHIFERFYRAQQAREQAPEGAGLGLSLATTIAQQHQARIEVESVPGAGSTFRVLFQLAS